MFFFILQTPNLNEHMYKNLPKPAITLANLLLIVIIITNCTQSTNSKEEVNLTLIVPENFSQTISFHNTIEGDLGIMDDKEIYEFNLRKVEADSSYLFVQTLKQIIAKDNTNNDNIVFDSAIDTVPEKMTESTKSLYYDIKHLINLEQLVTIERNGLIKKQNSENEQTNLFSTEKSLLPIELPEKIVQEGYTWSSTKNNPIINSKKINSTYILSKITPTELIIDFDIEAEGIVLNNGYTAKGNIVLDRNTRTLIKGEYQANLNVMNSKNKLTCRFTTLN